MYLFNSLKQFTIFILTMGVFITLLNILDRAAVLHLTSFFLRTVSKPSTLSSVDCFKLNPPNDDLLHHVDSLWKAK